MKNFITIILTFIFVNHVSSQIQQAEIIYKVKHVVPKNKIKLTPTQEKIKNRADRVMRETENIEMQLLFSKDHSVYKIIESMEIDDYRKKIRKIAEIVIGSNINYYCDLKKQIIIREHEFDGNNYNITSHFKDNNWKLINESKDIEGYICYKAEKIRTFQNSAGKTINSKITAWYTPKIPISLGPKNHVGLPGLIIELKEKGSIFYVTKINLNPKEKIIVINPKKGIKITEKEYSKITKGSKSKFINSMKN